MFWSGFQSSEYMQKWKESLLITFEEALNKIISNLRMRPLQTTERVLIWLCLLPADKTTSKWTKLSYFAFSAVVVTSNVTFFAASIVFFMRFYSTDLHGSFYAIFQITGMLPIIAMIIVSFCMRRKIEMIFEMFRQIYAESKKMNT